MVTFCWLPPDSRRASDCARVSICSRPMAAVTRRFSAPTSIGPQRRAGAIPGSPIFSRTDRCIEQRRGAIGGDEHDPGADGIGGMPELHGGAVHDQLAGSGPRLAGQDVEQLVLALALERDQPEHLAVIQVEGHIAQVARRAQRARRQPRNGVRGARLGGRRGRWRDGALGRCRAEHQGDDLLLGAGARGDVDHAHRAALAQDGRPVAQAGDLEHAVRDEDHRTRGAAVTGNDVENAGGEVGRQGGGHLVQQQDVGLDRQRPRQVDHAQGRPAAGRARGRAGRARECRARRCAPGRESIGVSVSARFSATVRSGMMAGSW